MSRVKNKNSRQRKRETFPFPLFAVIVLAVLAAGTFAVKGITVGRGRDITPPSITFTRDNRYFVVPGEEYEEEGFRALDDRDGDLTSQVVCSAEGDLLSYRVSDSAGNITIRYRRIPYRINGFDPDPEAADTETADTDLDENEKTAAAKDRASSILYNKIPAEIPDDKVIYLTFDDGPCQNTERLLNILNQYRVRATFFVTGAAPVYADMIAAEAAAGHSVGVHTYSHDFPKIYKNTDAFWKDFEKMQDVIVRETGARTNLMRFAGGSSNTISSDITPGIMTELAEEALAKGYQYFDWNVSSGDGAAEGTPQMVIDNITSQVPNHSVSVILCHDTKEYTINAMEIVIPWALENGYVFLPLKIDSEPAHHEILN